MSLTIVLVIMTSLISFQAFNNPNMNGQLLFHPVVMRENGQWYRFLTHGFLHADLMHLLVNMFVLWQFGSIIEKVFLQVFGELNGRLVFLLFYFSAIVASSISSYFKHRFNPTYAAVGASGATSALVFGYILFAPWQWFVFPPLPAILFGVAYLWYSSYMEKRGLDNIAHGAHFWGAVYGVAFILIAMTFVSPSFPRVILQQLLAGPKAPSFLQ